MCGWADGDEAKEGSQAHEWEGSAVCPVRTDQVHVRTSRKICMVRGMGGWSLVVFGRGTGFTRQRSTRSSSTDCWRPNG